ALRCRVPPGGYAPTTHIRHTQHNPYPVDLPIRIAGFTATPENYCLLVVFCNPSRQGWNYPYS
ncbi:TPA: hypothetical protein ACWV4V_005267, partial [Salmonella enterica subsp. enterica serovar Muenchen]